MNLEELVDQVVQGYEDNPCNFSVGIISPMNSEGEDFNQLENMLMERLPNLIITHSDTDTKKERQKQLARIFELHDQGITPYFIDLKQPVKIDPKILKKQL